MHIKDVLQPQTCFAAEYRFLLQWDVPVLPPEPCLLLVLEVVEGGGQAVAHVRGRNHLVDVAVLRGDIRVEVLLLVFGDELLARFGGGRRGRDFLPVKD